MYIFYIKVLMEIEINIFMKKNYDDQRIRGNILNEQNEYSIY